MGPAEASEPLHSTATRRECDPSSTCRETLILVSVSKIIFPDHDSPALLGFQRSPSVEGCSIGTLRAVPFLEECLCQEPPYLSG